MLKNIFFSVALLCVIASLVQAETISRIAAVVNDEIITTFQLEREVERTIAKDGSKSSEEDRDALRKTILDRLIEEALVRQRVEELGLQVSDDEIEQAITDVERQNRLNRQQLIEALSQQGLDFFEYRENLRKQILRFKLLGREVNAKVDVTLPEIDAYYRENIENYRSKPYVRLTRLSFYFSAETSSLEKSDIYDRAVRAQGQLLEGTPFNQVLAAVRKEGNIDGGDMGTFGENELIPRFVKAIEGLKPGGVTSVLETDTGYHILIVTERNSGEPEPLESLRPEIEQILREKKTGERFKEWSSDLKEKAFIDVRL